MYKRQQYKTYQTTNQRREDSQMKDQKLLNSHLKFVPSYVAMTKYALCIHIIYWRVLVLSRLSKHKAMISSEILIHQM